MLKKELKELKKFMHESNMIEGENRINPGDIKAAEYACVVDPILYDNILELHYIIGDYLNKDWVGKWRNCNVIVGRYTPPSPDRIHELMKNYSDNMIKMNSWQAYNEFEKIHPFQDLNGRIGRLIWLSKALNEGYKFKLSFLEKYHYQTLDNYK